MWEDATRGIFHIFHLPCHTGISLPGGAYGIGSCLACSEGHLRSSPSWQKAGDHFLDNLDPRGQNHVHVLLFAQSNSAGAEDSDRMVGMAGCLVPPLEALMKCVHMFRLLAAAAASAAIQEAAECTVAGSCEHVRDLEQVCLKTVESRAACLQLGMP